MDRNCTTIGRVTVLALWDGGTEADVHPATLSDVFPAVPAERWAPYRARLPACFPSPDEWVADFNPWLVRTTDRTVLVDAGVGPPTGRWPGATGGLLDSLNARGIRPEDVDVVVLTHLHVDHVGWIMTDDGVPTFPRARYVLSRNEWAFVQRPAGRNADEVSIAQDVARLADLGMLDLLTGETALTDEVRVIPTHGHTPGHLSVLVASDGQQGLLMGDLVHHPAQVSEPGWCTVWDVAPGAAAATRTRVLELVEREGIVAASYHFPAPGFGRIVRQGDLPAWVPLEPVLG